MLSSTKHNISDALRGLRGGIAIAAVMISLALMLQVSTWVCVTFTEFRWTRIATSEASGAPVIVNEPVQENPFGWPQEQAELKHESKPSRRTGTTPGSLADDAGVDPNVIASRFDVWFKVMHELGFFLGLAGTILLCVELFLAVCVASVSDAPGIGRVSQAQVLSMVLLAAAFPWFLVAPDGPFPGAFTRYAVLSSDSQSYLAGAPEAMSSGMYYARYVLIPLAMFIALARITWNFTIGSMTTIIAGPTQFELAIEEEASGRKAGSVFQSGRASNAMRAAVGSSLHLAPEEPAVTSPSGDPPPPRRII